MKYTIPSILLSLLLSACGGGGNNSVSSEPVISAKLYDTSYKNFKLNGTDSIKYPHYLLRWGGDALAIGFGDFLKADELSVFVAYQNYEPWSPLSQIQSNPNNYASEYVFYTVNKDKSLTKSISMKGCLHPRKAVVADFNKDNIADVFVACTGYDSSPFPGEKSQLILSSGRGQYTIIDVGNIGFNHGASAADINNDGYPDIVVSDGSNIIFYINQRNGTFITDSNRTANLNLSNTAYYNIELLDVDSDGKVDIVTGGHEHENATTKVIYANSDGTHGSRVTNVPNIQTKGVVNDFTLVGNVLYVNRTSDSTDILGWYKGLTIQSFNLNTGVSNIIANTKVIASDGWVPWLLPKITNNQNGAGPYNSNAFYQ